MTKIKTSQNAARPLYATAVTDAAFTALPLPLLDTQPSGDGYFGEFIPNQVVLAFYGLGNNNATLNARISLVKMIVKPLNGAVQAPQWARMPVATLACTLGNNVGLGSGIIPSTNRFVDSITVTGNTNTVPAPTAVIAEGLQLLRLDTIGCEDIYIELNTDAGSVTNANVMVWPV